MRSSELVLAIAPTQDCSNTTPPLDFAVERGTSRCNSKDRFRRGRVGRMWVGFIAHPPVRLAKHARRKVSGGISPTFAPSCAIHDLAFYEPDTLRASPAGAAGALCRGLGRR